MTKLKVTMLGTGSPWPDVERSGPAQILWIDDQPILIDCGEKASYQLSKANIDLASIDYVFLTHLHADHILGYGQFLLGRWFSSRKKLTLIGPKGTKQFHQQILKMYEEDIAYKLSLGRPSEGLLDTNIIEIESSGEIEIDLPKQVKLRTAEMIHSILTYAYRFDTGEQSVVFSGDTAPVDELVKLSLNADTMVVDCCLAPNKIYSENISEERKRIWKELQKEHCDPEQAAKMASQAEAKQLILTHFLPGTLTDITHLLATKHFAGEVIVPADLDEILVPGRKSRESLSNGQLGKKYSRA
ncbi:MBL fold metallo-hydrolase [Sporosarcina sp. FSL W7-1283]|uniref:MBL fold metallo-hydrolase n=1 Tax=Sporosarcina sp. FSL W7-1283 TaxID=2921560 RepID=UPI0030F9DAD9